MITAPKKAQAGNAASLVLFLSIFAVFQIIPSRCRHIFVLYVMRIDMMGGNHVRNAARQMIVLLLMPFLLLFSPYAHASAPSAAPFSPLFVPVPPEVVDIQSIQAAKDDTLYMLAKHTDGSMALYHYMSPDSLPEQLSIPLFDEHEPTAFRIAPDGNLLVKAFRHLADGKRSSHGYYWIDKEGDTVSKCVRYGSTTDYIALSDRRTIAYDSDASLHDENGAQILHYRTKVLRHLLAHEGTLYAVSQHSIDRLVLETGESLGHSKLELEKHALMRIAPDGTLYAASETDVYRLSPEDGTHTQVISWLDALSSFDDYIRDFAALTDGIVLLLSPRSQSSDEKETRMLQYHPNLPIADGRTPFFVDSLSESAAADTAAITFQRLHPELFVIRRVHANRRMAPNIPDDVYPQLLCSELFRNSSDVLILDGLPFDKLLDYGMLQDVSALGEALHVLPFMQAAYADESGHVYALPLSFRMDLAQASPSVLSGEARSIPPQTYEPLIRLLYPTYRAAFVGDDGSPDYACTAFASFLQAIRALCIGQPAGGITVPLDAVAIHAGSQQRALCEEFIALMASAENRLEAGASDLPTTLQSMDASVLYEGEINVLLDAVQPFFTGECNADEVCAALQ